MSDTNEAPKPRLGLVSTEQRAELKRLEAIAGPPMVIGRRRGALVDDTAALLRGLRERFGVSDDPDQWVAEEPAAAGGAEVGELERRRAATALRRLQDAEVPDDPLVVLVGFMPGGEALLSEEQKRVLAGICLQVRPEKIGELMRTTALRVARAWRHGGTVGSLEFSGTDWLIVFSGSTGVGKSLAAGWIVRETPRRGLWISADDVGRVRGGKGDELFDRAVDAPLLVLDEAGIEHAGATDYAKIRIGTLLLKRSQHRRDTVVTTNGAKTAFLARYGGEDGRLAARMSGAPYIELPASDPDLRQGGR